MTEEQPGPGYVSFSQLSTAARCGEEYRLKYMGPRPDFAYNVPALAGTAFHAALMDWEISTEEDQKDPTFDWDHAAHTLVGHTKDIVRGIIADGELDVDLMPFYGRQDLPYYFRLKIPAMTKSYLTRRQEEVKDLNFRWGLKDSADASIEVECLIEVGGLPFKAFIDQVFFDSKGRLVVRDIKTGKPKIEHAMQLEVYRLALKKAFGVEAEYGQVLYLNKPEPYQQVVKWSLSDGEVEDMTARLVRSVNSGLFLINGPFNGSCGTCDFQPDCRFGQVDVHGVA